MGVHANSTARGIVIAPKCPAKLVVAGSSTKDPTWFWLQPSSSSFLALLQFVWDHSLCQFPFFLCWTFGITQIEADGRGESQSFHFILSSFTMGKLVGRVGEPRRTNNGS